MRDQTFTKLPHLSCNFSLKKTDFRLQNGPDSKPGFQNVPAPADQVRQPLLREHDELDVARSHRTSSRTRRQGDQLPATVIRKLIDFLKISKRMKIAKLIE